MENKNVEELYEVLDEMNARIEAIFNEYNDPDTSELVFSMLNEKVQEFLYDLETDVEKLGLIKLEA